MSMDTKLVSKEDLIDKDILYGAKLIRDGQLVAFATETVYGLGANGLDVDAINKIYQAKGRPGDNPLILHVSSLKMAQSLTTDNLSDYKELIDRYWPGPLTIIVNKSSIVPSEATAGLDTVAIRMPNKELAIKLIEYSDTPIAAPSANISGRPSPTDATTVLEDLGGKIPLILDGGATDIGLESTVIDLTSQVPMVLRPGGVSVEELRELLGSVDIDPALKSSDEIPKSPGQKYTHYAPAKPAYLLTGSVGDKLLKLENFLEYNKAYGYMISEELARKIDIKDSDILLSYGSIDDHENIAENIFRILRELDKKDIDTIIIEGIEEKGLGLAIMNRLTKSAGNKIIGGINEDIYR